MKISTKCLLENFKSINSIISDFVYIDCTDESNYGFYVSTDTQATKIPLNISEISEDEKMIYVINKSEFMHLISYASEYISLNSNYEYSSNEGQMKGKFEKNEGFAEELESRKILFDNENEYDDFMEITPSIMNSLTKGSIFVAPDSIKPSERFLDIKNGKVFSYSNFKIYEDDIMVKEEGLLSLEIIKSIQSLGVGAIVKSNKNSYLISNAQRSIFEYFSTPNDVDFHPLFSDKFQKKLSECKNFNHVKFDISELRDKLDYISYYANKNKNSMCFLKYIDDSVFIYTDDNTFVKLSKCEFDKHEEFSDFSVTIDCSALQMVVAKLSKDCETLNFYVSNKDENKLILMIFGDSNETVIFSKLNY